MFVAISRLKGIAIISLTFHHQNVQLLLVSFHVLIVKRFLFFLLLLVDFPLNCAWCGQEYLGYRSLRNHVYDFHGAGMNERVHPAKVFYCKQYGPSQILNSTNTSHIVDSSTGFQTLGLKHGVFY